MKIIRFGIIGGGLMGREFASAAARWAHLLDMPARPQVVAVCDGREEPLAWFKHNFPSIERYCTDYRSLLADDSIDAVYVAIPHHLHREVYTAAIDAGKHLLGEKPFGIDLAANEAILASARRHPKLLVRCSSEFPFFPAVQRMCRMIEAGTFGQIIEVNAGFLHSSDLDPSKPINWKRVAAMNGEYGCMGDLGLHACHVPFRAGWTPQNVRAVLSNVFPTRPDGKGGRVACDTWDNATLLCEASEPDSTAPGFPMTLKVQRIAPGERNTWYLQIYGSRQSARWSSANPKLLELLDYQEPGAEQAWKQCQTGYEPAFKSITASIFEFGFTDSILQMWAAFVYELETGAPPSRFAGTVTPDETALSHRLFTAALRSHRDRSVVAV
jgi:predicted dehydrogenase